MPRDLLTRRAFVANAFLADPTGDAVTQANGNYIASGDKSEQIIVRVTQTAAAAKTITIKKGVNPPALAAGQGDFVSAPLAQNAVGWYGPFTSSRFLQDNGQILIDYEDGFTGSATYFVLPKTT